MLNTHKIAFACKELFLGRNSKKILRKLRESESFPREKIKANQEEQFKELMKRAWKSPFYRELYSSIGIKAEDLKSLKDIGKLTILTKDMFRENSERMLCEDIDTKKTILRRSSGSTGKRLIFRMLPDSNSSNLAHMLRGYSWWDVDPWETKIKFWGVPWQFEKTLFSKMKAFRLFIKDYLLGTTFRSAFNTNEDDFKKALKIVERKKPKVIFGYGTALFMFAEYINKMGGMKHRFKCAIYTSETLNEYHREIMTKAFKCPIISEYGSVETGIIAYQCSCGNYHVSEEKVFLEILDENNTPVKNGVGRAVITYLTERSLPIIRYDLGDIIEVSEHDNECDNGITLKTFKKITGRANDLIKSPTGKYVHPELFDYTMRYFPGIERFKIIEKDIGILHVLLQSKDEIDEKRIDGLLEELNERMGGGFNLTCDVVPLIENEPSGKFRWVVGKGY